MISLIKTPRAFTDINALMQTMSLQKYKFITNRYINQMRVNVRKSIITRLQTGNNASSNRAQSISSKVKYTFQLPLRPPKDSNDKARYVCNTNWPVCMFDHALKGYYASFFRYRVESTGKEWVDDYFVKERDELQEEDMELMRERNKHYCTNKAFVEKINKLIESKEQHEEAFSAAFRDSSTEEAIDNDIIMQKFIAHILAYKSVNTEKDSNDLKKDNGE